MNIKRNSLFHYGLAAIAAIAVMAGLYFLSGPEVAAAGGFVTAVTVTAFPLTTDVSAQARAYPVDVHGKIRFAYFKYVNNTGGALADGTEIDLHDMPEGRVRILPNLSRIRCTALGAARVLDLGYRAYFPTNNPGTAEAEDDDAFIANKDVSAAVNDSAWDGGAAKMKYDVFSRNGFRLFATVDGGTIPALAEIEGFCAYVYE